MPPTPPLSPQPRRQPFVPTQPGDATVVLRLDGPMQAWGATASWETRPTLSRPTKAGTIGMIANAVGRCLADDITDLGVLRFSVRADRPGHLETDDQTAGGGAMPPLLGDYLANPNLAAAPASWAYGAPRGPQLNPDGVLVAPWATRTRTIERATVMLRKTYVVDAAFLVGLTGPADLVHGIADAVVHPARLLYLGRRCCPPAYPLLHTVTDQPDWFLWLPLLAGRATTHHPTAWYETTPAAENVTSSPEQPGPVVNTHRMLYLAHLPTTPPPAPPDPEPTP